MKKHFLPLALLLSLGATGCDRSPLTILKESITGREPQENITPQEKQEAAAITPGKDPIVDQIYASKLPIRQAFNNRRFDELEAQAAELRASKATFDNGTWKIVSFYDAFDCSRKEPESMWQLHDSIYKAWIAAKPDSITARVAYAQYLTNYAWFARGGGYASTVGADKWPLFRNRLAAAKEVLEKAKELPEKDPVFWLTGLTVALGQGWPRNTFELLHEEAIRFEPTFWHYDSAAAVYLLPRWHGKKGDWEDYLDKTAVRANASEAEIYARVVLSTMSYYDHIFRETKASWPKTREGLEAILKKHPNSITITSRAALLATMAEDREFAKQMFDRLGNTYIPRVWEKPEKFAHYRHWAETGVW